MRNPFQYGNVVGEEAFCNRKKELSDLRRAMENGEKLFLYSERRLGKTSLVKLALQKLPKSKFVRAYVDLLPRRGRRHPDLLRQRGNFLNVRESPKLIHDLEPKRCFRW